MARDPNFKIKYFFSQNCSVVVPFIKNLPKVKDYNVIQSK